MFACFRFTCSIREILCKQKHLYMYLSSQSSDVYKLLDEALSSNIESQSIAKVQNVTEQIKSSLEGGLALKSYANVALTSENLVEYISSYYQSLNDDDIESKKHFFSFLVRHLGFDRGIVKDTAQRLIDLYKQKRDYVTLLRCEGQLQKSIEPLYYKLLSLLAKNSGGLKILIDMRKDLLEIITNLKTNNNSIVLYDELNGQLQKLLSQWFSLGFLDLQQVTWQSPCDIVEKVSQYEAVHSIRHWKDIKHRVGPHRRVYIFTHRGLPRDPIVILHSALTTSPSSNIQTLLNREINSNNDSADVTTAVFYSISAAHKGLSGIELGNHLIDQVVEVLKKEFPTLKQFVTLSPIPGFRKWLDGHIRLCFQNPSSECKVSQNELSGLLSLFHTKENYLKAFQDILITHNWTERMSDVTMALKQPLLSLCARYLIEEKRRGYAINPVTNFHVKNGASLWRLNWLANTSPNGLQQSYGIMANYEYDLLTTRDNSQCYILQGKIPYSDAISKLLVKL